MTLRRHLEFEPHAPEIERFNLWLDDAVVAAGTEKQIASDLKLCTNEALANLISYAFTDTVAPVITVELALDTSSARAVIYDNGTSFPLHAWPQQERPTALENAKPGGLGLYLIRERARQISYESSGSLNKLTIDCGH